MTEHHKSEETVGDCGVCNNSLPVGANHAYTACKHLFCISCLLKWHKTNPNATCPMCRAPLYEDESDADNAEQAVAAQSDEEEVESFEMSYQLEQERTRQTLEEMDLNQDERSMHNGLMLLVDDHVERYCGTNPTCTYTGTTSLHIIHNPEYDYSRIEVGVQDLNCHYVIELRDASRAFRYKFGRIEDIVNHHIYSGISWFVFREVNILNEDTGLNDAGHTTMWSPETQIIEWSHETQLIAFVRVSSLRQYVPRMRISV